MLVFLTVNVKVKDNVHHLVGAEGKIFVVTIKRLSVLLLKKKDLYVSQTMNARDKGCAMIMILFVKETLIVDSFYI